MILIDCSFHQQRGGLNIRPIFDCGLVVENIMLLATNCGFGLFVKYRRRRVLCVKEAIGIPNCEPVARGVVVGYPDWNDSVNKVRSERAYR